MKYDIDKLMEEIRLMILKTIVAVQPIMAEAYRASRP